MKEIGIIRKIDKLGRIVLPKKLRWKYKIDCGEMIEIYTNEDRICIKKYDQRIDVIERVESLYETVERMEKELQDTKDLQEYLKRIKGKLAKLGAE